MVIRTKHKHNVLTKNGTIVQEEQMRESASADGIFRSILSLETLVSSHKHHMEWSFLVEWVREKSSNQSRRKHYVP